MRTQNTLHSNCTFINSSFLRWMFLSSWRFLLFGHLYKVSTVLYLSEIMMIMMNPWIKLNSKRAKNMQMHICQNRSQYFGLMKFRTNLNENVDIKMLIGNWIFRKRKTIHRKIYSLFINACVDVIVVVRFSNKSAIIMCDKLFSIENNKK